MSKASLVNVRLIDPIDGLLSSTKSLIQTINSSAVDSAVEVVIAPPAIYLLLVKEHLTNSKVQVAAQNVFDKAQGAYTGEISYIAYLSDCITYVLVLISSKMPTSIGL
jgi:triosephosphate isomerase (TIM)